MLQERSWRRSTLDLIYNEKKKAHKTMKQRVLVTGSEGGVGRAVCKRLSDEGHKVYRFDRLANLDLNNAIAGDITNRDQVREATHDMDAIIHLAATPDEADFLEELIEPNVRGLYNVCDAARENGVARLVLASSVQVVSGHRWDSMVQIEDGPKVINHYALTKLWAEQIGEMYARMYGLSVIAARLGWLPRDPAHAEELQASPVGTDVYLSHDDAGRFFSACVDASMQDGNFEILFATSKPLQHVRVDPEPALRVVGYRAHDTWPEGHAFPS
tara:strand:+ start:450 stop:1265 length:816 start_codon:yes stop_codon:yes gene_type:complete